MELIRLIWEQRPAAGWERGLCLLILSVKLDQIPALGLWWNAVT